MSGSSVNLCCSGGGVEVVRVLIVRTSDQEEKHLCNGS